MSYVRYIAYLIKYL